MKVGRNDPCPCGSGKKYKKCCLSKDQAGFRSQSQFEKPPNAPPVPEPRPRRDKPPVPFLPPTLPERPTRPKPPPDPHMEALNARWKEFEGRDYEGRIALFLQTLDEPELLDEENAFGMLNELFGPAVKHNERERFQGLVDALRQRRPDVYAEMAHYCLSWSISNALAAGRRDAIPSLARELASLAGKHIDEFNRVVDQLAYHGELDVLVEMMRIAWPVVKPSKDIVPWGVSKFADRGAEYETFAYLDQMSSPDPADRALLDRQEFFHEHEDDLRPGLLAEQLKRLTGKSEKVWALRDFEMKPARRRSRDDFDDDFEEGEEKEQPVDRGLQNLHHLSFEFLGWLRREHGVPWTKGEMVRENLVRYLVERHEGELEPRPSMLEEAMNPGKYKPPPRRKPDHALCPDRQTLDSYLSRLLGFLSMRYYDVAAVWEIVPLWLRFLTTRGLLEDEQHQKTLQQLSQLNASLLKVWKNYQSDPSLERASKAWEQPG
jgi:hypothetical protein